MKRFFNLIEIVLAMAVLAVGMTGVMALFPVGFKANNESVETNNAVLVANKLYSIIKAAKSMNTGNPWTDQHWFLNTDIPAPPNHRPCTNSGETLYVDGLYCGRPCLADKPVSVTTKPDPFGLYAVGDGPGTKGTGGNPYPGLIYAETGVQASDGTIPLPSFSAHIRLWWYPVFRGKLKPKADPADPSFDPLSKFWIPDDKWEKGWDSGRTATVNYDMFDTNEIVGVYMEVSWPATIPWKNRTYRYFYFELYKNN